MYPSGNSNPNIHYVITKKGSVRTPRVENGKIIDEIEIIGETVFCFAF